MTPAWEGIAADVLASTGCDDPPVDAIELAELCGLEVAHVPHVPGGRLVGRRIEVNPKLRLVRLHGTVAHELAHDLLERAKEENTEPAARYLAGALMLPRRAFLRDMGQTQWSLVLLRERHPNASAEMIARRIVSLRDAVASIWDEGRCRVRVASPWLDERVVGRRTTALERGLAAHVLETGKVERPADLVWAVPFFDGKHRRVVVVVEAEQLALRWP